jgi:hypothetical protein
MLIPLLLLTGKHLGGKQKVSPGSAFKVQRFTAKTALNLEPKKNFS